MAGKPNYVWDVENEQTVLGRFGWKANQPSIRQQTASGLPRRYRRDHVPVPGGELSGRAGGLPGRSVGEQVRGPGRMHGQQPIVPKWCRAG